MAQLKEILISSSYNQLQRDFKIIYRYFSRVATTPTSQSEQQKAAQAQKYFLWFFSFFFSFIFVVFQHFFVAVVFPSFSLFATFSR